MRINGSTPYLVPEADSFSDPLATTRGRGAAAPTRLQAGRGEAGTSQVAQAALSRANRDIAKAERLLDEIDSARARVPPLEKFAAPGSGGSRLLSIAEARSEVGDALDRAERSLSQAKGPQPPWRAKSRTRKPPRFRPRRAN